MSTNERTVEESGKDRGGVGRTVVEYPLRARHPVLPDETGPMPFMVTRAGRMVDVVLPPNVAVVQARIGRVRYSREEMKASLTEFFALDLQEDVNAGTYCVFTVMNVGKKPVQVEGRVLMEGEHGEAVEGLPLREVDASDETSSSVPTPRVGAKRNPANDAMVEALIDSAEIMVDGSPVQRRSARAGGGTLQSAKPKKVMTQNMRRRLAEEDARRAAAAVASMATDSNLRMICLHVGHVGMLDVALNACFPLTQDVRIEISGALRDALEASDESARELGIGMVMVRLSEADCVRLAEAIDTKTEYVLDDNDAICAAVQYALDADETTPDDVADESAADESQPVVSAPIGASDSGDTDALGSTQAEVGNVTPIHVRVDRADKDVREKDARDKDRPSAVAKNVVNEA